MKILTDKTEKINAICLLSGLLVSLLVYFFMDAEPSQILKDGVLFFIYFRLWIEDI